MIHGSFVMGQVRAGKLTQEVADAIKAKIDGLVKSLTERANGSGSQYDGQAEGTRAIVAAFKDAVATMGESGEVPKDIADLLAQNAERLTARASAAMYLSSALRGITSKYLSVYGLANNRAVSDEQVKVIVAALEELKAAFPSSADAIDSQIFKVANLTIGRKAPNIKGIDTDEVEFELKEYLGRVVVIDFWGDW